MKRFWILIMIVVCVFSFSTPSYSDSYFYRLGTEEIRATIDLLGGPECVRTILSDDVQLVVIFSRPKNEDDSGIRMINIQSKRQSRSPFIEKIASFNSPKRTFEEALRACELLPERTSPEDKINFSDADFGPKESAVFAFKIEARMDQVLAEMSRCGYRPATPMELLAYEESPGVAGHDFPIVAFGGHRVSWMTCVEGINYDNDSISLQRRLVQRPDFGTYGAHCRFLGIKK